MRIMDTQRERDRKGQVFPLYLVSSRKEEKEEEEEEEKGGIRRRRRSRKRNIDRYRRKLALPILHFLN